MVGTIISFVLGLFKGRTYILYILAAVLFSGTVGIIYYKYINMGKQIQEHELTIAMQGDRILALKNLNKENINQLQRLVVDHNRTLNILETKYKNQKEKVRIITVIKERIKYVKKEDDGDVAPILSSTFERLRAMQTKNSTKNSNPKSESSNAVN